MLFTSFQYIVLLCFAAVIVRVLPLGLRCYVLIAISYYYYSFWSIKYVALIFLITLLNYVISLYWLRTRNNIRYLAAAIAVNLAVLIYFKYTNFIVGTIDDIGGLLNLGNLNAQYSIVLPVGISFYLFQIIGYLIDLNRGTVSVEKDFGKFALYVSFFPQLLAGPIERANKLLPQLSSLRRPSKFEIITAISLISWGLFKKIVIADNIESIVRYTFTDGAEGGILTTIIGLYSFSIEVFCDFSAYTDIAVGSALLFGVRLTQNFRDPYFATSVRDFWTRWHISLTSWFRDYTYYPICFTRKLRITPVFGIVIVFTLSGFWHGASWTYVAWGLYWGTLLALEEKYRIEKILGTSTVALWLRRFVLFNIVGISWLLFRAKDFHQGIEVLTRLGDLSIYSHDYVHLMILVTCSIPLVLSFFIRSKLEFRYRNILVGILAFVGVLVAMIFGVDTSREFIYFEF